MTTKQQELAVLAALMAKYGITGPKAKAAKAAKPQPKAAPAVSKEDKSAAFAEAAVAAAKARGFANVQPNVNLLTYTKWEANGFRPRKGEKSIRVKTKGMKGQGIPLFHSDQCEAIAA